MNDPVKLSTPLIYKTLSYRYENDTLKKRIFYVRPSLERLDKKNFILNTDD